VNAIECWLDLHLSMKPEYSGDDVFFLIPPLTRCTRHNFMW